MNKLFELLDTAMKTGNMIVRTKPKRGCCYAIRYFPECEEFLCVNHRTGEKVPKHESGFVRVNLSKGLLDGDYILMPVPNSEPQPAMAKSVFGNVINPNDNYEIWFKDTKDYEQLIYGHVENVTMKSIYVSNPKADAFYIIPLNRITFMLPNGMTEARSNRVAEAQKEMADRIFRNHTK